MKPGLTTATSYGFTRGLVLSYKQAVVAIIEALRADGVRVLPDNDLRHFVKTFEFLEAIGGEFRQPFVIWDMRKPPFTHCALSTELESSLRLMRNVAIYEDEMKSVVSVIDPDRMMNADRNPELRSIAQEARMRIERAIRTL